MSSPGKNPGPYLVKVKQERPETPPPTLDLEMDENFSLKLQHYDEMDVDDYKPPPKLLRVDYPSQVVNNPKQNQKNRESQPAGGHFSGDGFQVQPAGDHFSGDGFQVQPAGGHFSGDGFQVQPAGGHFSGDGFQVQPAGGHFSGDGFQIGRRMPTRSTKLDKKLINKKVNAASKIKVELSPTNLKEVGVLGNGKGTVYPKHEMDSVYNFIIPDADANSKNPKPWLQNPILPPPGIKPTILAVVASASLGVELDLEKIANIATNLSYNESSYAQLVMRIYDPMATAMYWKSGKMVVTGTDSVEKCRTAVVKFAAAIIACGYKRARPLGVRIQNITAKCNVGFKIRIPSLGADKSHSIFYNPDVFAGVMIQLTIPKAKIIVFRTGSILIIGVKSEEELDEVFHIVYPYLKLFAV